MEEWKNTDMNENLKRCCVDSSATLLEGLHAIDLSGEGVALVVDKDMHLLGVLTDGDVRRALLHGATLDMGLMAYLHEDFLSVGTESGRAEVLDLMQAHVLRHIPVLNKKKQVIGLHLLHNLIGIQERPNWAVVMAGGKGTRLKPITDHLPKPMIKIAGRPILERLILHLVGYGVRRIFISVNTMREVIEDYFRDGSQLGCSIEYLREDEPLGTGGAISLLPEQPIDPLLVMNGDLVMQTDFGKLLNAHCEGQYFATMGVQYYCHKVPYGCVDVNETMQLLTIKEKPIMNALVNAGVYVLSPQAVATVPRQYYPITQLFESALKTGRICGAFQIKEDWIDIGEPEHLNRAQGKIN